MNVEREIDHDGGFQLMDPLVQVLVRCDEINEEVVEAVETAGREHHKYTVVVGESGKLEIVKAVFL